MNNNYKTHSYLAVGVLSVGLLLVFTKSVIAQSDDLRVNPDPSVQAALEKMDPLVWEDPVEFHRQAYALRQNALKPAEVESLIRHVAYFASRPNDTLAVSRPIVFRQFMYFTQVGTVGHVQVINALAPLVDSSDGFIREFVIKSVLGGVDLEADWDVDFTALYLYGVHHPGKFSPTLVDIMLRQSPSKAAPQLAGIFHLEKATNEQLMLADHAVQDVLFYSSYQRLRPAMMDDAVAQLQALLKSKDWWVRRYVAEIVWRHDMFRRPELVNPLMADSDPRIVTAVSRPKPPELREP